MENPHPDLLRAGKHDPVDPRVLPQRVADVLPVAGEEIDHTRRDTRVAIDLVELIPGPAGDLGRLEDHRVAGNQRRARHPRGQRQREIERGNAGKHPVRTLDVGVVLDRGQVVHRPDEPVGFVHLIGVIVDQVGALFRVPDRLHPVLADLDAHHRRQFEPPFPNQGRGPPHDDQPLPPRHPAPGHLGLLGRGHGPVDVFGRPRGKHRQDDPGIDRAPVDDGVRANLDPLTPDHQGMERTEPAPYRREGPVELPVKRLHVDVGGGVGDLPDGGRHAGLPNSKTDTLRRAPGRTERSSRPSRRPSPRRAGPSRPSRRRFHRPDRR